ncbi:60S ribosomal protein L30-like [Onychomys torridus]|uniref:60S ribosomal protein L30-like n=1 Tax=Onychomys torridus TaxID=38674 RepID=UPI00167F5EA8|nr:60S ribosomal protein L30-like [Onychomys torridus]
MAPGKNMEIVSRVGLLVLKSGKCVVGYKEILKMIRQGKLVIPDNCAAVRKSGLEYYALLAETGAQYYSDNNIELDTACRNYYRVHTLAVIDLGNSDILRGMSEQTRER